MSVLAGFKFSPSTQMFPMCGLHVGPCSDREQHTVTAMRRVGSEVRQTDWLLECGAHHCNLQTCFSSHSLRDTTLPTASVFRAGHSQQQAVPVLLYAPKLQSQGPSKPSHWHCPVRSRLMPGSGIEIFLNIPLATSQPCFAHLYPVMASTTG